MRLSISVGIFTNWRVEGEMYFLKKATPNRSILAKRIGYIRRQVMLSRSVKRNPIIHHNSVPVQDKSNDIVKADAAISG